jgi:hypothetical protein
MIYVWGGGKGFQKQSQQEITHRLVTAHHLCVPIRLIGFKRVSFQTVQRHLPYQGTPSVLSSLARLARHIRCLGAVPRTDHVATMSWSLRSPWRKTIHHWLLDQRLHRMRNLTLISTIQESLGEAFQNMRPRFDLPQQQSATG